MLHTHNTFKNFIQTIFLAIKWITISILLMSAFMYSLLFATDHFEDPIILIALYIIIPILVLFVYQYYLKICHIPSLFSPKYVQLTKLSWSIKFSLITVSYFATSILSGLVYTGESENQKILKEQAVDFPSSFLGASFNAPIIEEVIFRGMLFIIILTATSFLFNETNRKSMFLRMAIYVTLSTIIFGFLHVLVSGDYQHVFPYLVPGFIYSIVFALTRDIKVTILLHILNNSSVHLYEYGYEQINVVINILLVLTALIGLFIYFKSDDFKQLRHKWEYHQYIKLKRKFNKVETP